MFSVWAATVRVIIVHASIAPDESIINALINYSNLPVKSTPHFAMCSGAKVN